MAEPRPSHSALCAAFESNASRIRYGLGAWQGYSEGIWAEVPELTVRKALHSSMLEALPALTNYDVNSVLALLKARVFVPDGAFDNDPDLLAFDDGVLRVSTNSFTPHNSDYHLTSKLPFTYDPAADSEAWENFLNQTVPDCEEFLQEFAGLCLTTEMRYETALWFHGPPGGGKSTFIVGLQAMLGTRGCVLGLNDIESSHFGLSHLPGKTLAISTEQPAYFMKSAHILNAIISGEPINIDRKYRDQITLFPKCKLVWAMNELPRIDARGVGLFRRVKLVHFPAIQATQRDPKVKEAVMRSGMAITNWALAGLRRLQEQGKFNIPLTVEEATENYRLSNDVTYLFIEDCCDRDDSGRVQAATLYSSYRKWCDDNGHKPVSSKRLAPDLERMGFHSLKNNVTYWCGLRLRDPSDTILDGYANGE